MRDRIEIYLMSTEVEYTLPMTPEHFDATRRGLADIQGHMLPVEDRDGRWILVALKPEEQAAFGRLLTKIGVGKASHDIARCSSGQ